MKRQRPLGPKHLVLPDTQCRPGDQFDHVAWAARYAADKRPDVIVQLGDWFDFPSLSSYDEGTRAMEGRDVADDLRAGENALDVFEAALKQHAPRSYKPRKVFIRGNHETRLDRYLQGNPKHMKTYAGRDTDAFEAAGWEAHGFLEPVEVHGITYSHYFCIGPKGRVTNSKNGAPSAEAQVRRMMRSCTAGHRQGLDVAIVHTPNATYRGVIAGSFYRHEEEYLTPQGVTHWRGILVKHDIDTRSGFYNLLEVDLRYLERKYG